MNFYNNGKFNRKVTNFKNRVFGALFIKTPTTRKGVSIVKAVVCFGCVYKYVKLQAGQGKLTSMFIFKLITQRYEEILYRGNVVLHVLTLC